MLVQPEDINAVMADHLEACNRLIVPLAAMGPDNDVLEKATGILVEFNGQKMLITAAHVLDGMLQLKGSIAVLLSPGAAAGAPVLRRLTHIEPVPIVTTPVWRSSQLDLVALKPPPQLLVSPNHTWLDADASREVTDGYVKKVWKETTTETQSLPFSVLGFPRLGYFRSAEARQIIVSSVPAIAYISSWHESDGMTAKSAQIWFELDIDGTTPADLLPIEQAIAAGLQYEPPKNEPSPFSGWSGGAVFLHAPEGDYLVGVVTDGGRIWGTPRIVAVPTDVMVGAYLSE